MSQPARPEALPPVPTTGSPLKNHPRPSSSGTLPAKKLILLLSALFILTGTPGTQEEPPASEPQPLSRDYRGISLGMNRPEVEDLLRADPRFDFRGQADLSLLERPRASLIDTGGSLFISRGLFQFEDESLIAIVLELNRSNVDWYSLYTSLEERYGPPGDINPQTAVWEDESTRLVLERPLTVKYLDLAVFNAALEDRQDRAAWKERAREEFLSEF